MFILVGLGVLLAQSPSAEFHVKVTDRSGGLVEDAIVRLSVVPARTCRTQRNGECVFPGLAKGVYRIMVAKEGFAEWRLAADVLSERVEMEVKLEVGTSSYAVEVVGSTPLAGTERAIEEIPAAVQASGEREIAASGALDVSDFLVRRMNGVYWNEIQGNPLQPDLNYRGYTASPLLGTPQGVSVYLDGVRMNQPFGDIVSWDLIPRIAISEVALIPGSNPLFGLNTLGGSVSLRTKDGATHPGTSLAISGGSFGRRLAEIEHGGAARNGFHWYLAGVGLFEDGWRQASPSNARQLFSKWGWQGARTSMGLTVGYANNGLIGNGLQEQGFLARSYSSVYTLPDQTAHRAPFLNLNVRRELTPRWLLSANGYFRYVGTRTLNGDINEESLDQSVYQPNAAERAALAAAGFTGFPAGGENAANTPFPRWRCIANILRRDEPSEKCNGLLNRGATAQRNYGVTGQLSWTGGRHRVTAGAGYDGNRVAFGQSTELGYLNPDRSVTGLGAFGDGVSGGVADDEPYDVRVDLVGRIHSASLYATDTMNWGRWSATVSGRFNATVIDNLDRLRPAPGTGSLTGRHWFPRFNPAVGVTYRARGGMNFYAGYTEGSRAPTSIELGCADPNAPCRLPNAMAGDPPLDQVVTRTYEAGIRGRGEKNLRWSAGWFHADNRNDILFVASEQTGFGYFKNFGRTRRQGAEFSIDGRAGRVTWGGGYTLLDATFRSGEEVNGSGNSTNEEALAGRRGLEAAIEIEPGNRIPLTPRHLVKTFADIQATRRLVFHLGVVGVSSSFARGNENNQHRPDGTFYLGPGQSPGYAIANAGARFEVRKRVQLFVQANNLFDRRFYTAAQLGPTGFTDAGGYVARPFPAVGGEFPVRQSTFFAPGAPRGVWGGVRVGF